MQSAFRVFKGAFRRIGNLTRWLRPRTRRVTYWPQFESDLDLANHFYRACWYLPEGAGACRRVVFGVKPGVTLPQEPPIEDIAAPESAHSHMRLAPSRMALLRAVVMSDVVIFWQCPASRWTRRMLQIVLGIRLVYVNTDDTTSVEFGTYPAILWDHLLGARARRNIIRENRERFVNLAAQVRQQAPVASAVFGTGPSIDRAHDFDWSGICTVVCNSIVRDDALLDHIRPRFICAGDAVSHFGVSQYAVQFRQDLERQLTRPDLHFVTTAPFGYLLLQHRHALRDRVFLLEHGPLDPVFDLAATYALPRLDSTLNIHMLPLAATFARTVFILGCDGKAPSGDNEDFWAHAQATQYHDLVESGHRCHPTFNLRRQQTTYARYLRSVEISLDGGTRAGLRYASIAPSHVPPIHACEVLADHPALKGLQKPIPVRVIAERLGVTPS